MRALQILIVAAFLVLAAMFAVRLITRGPAPVSSSRAHIQGSRPLAAAPAAPPPQAGCPRAPGFIGAAARNAASLDTAAWSAFGRAESGWRTYAVLTAREISTSCPPEADGFAQALAGWQRAHGLADLGIMDEPTLTALRTTWLLRRPFVAATAHGACPAPPSPDRLAWARPDEVYGGKPAALRADALEAYRALLAAARRELPELARERRLLSIFSGYREPLADLADCEASGDCGTVARARCSAHRTGLAVDLYLGEAPGHRLDSADDVNRRYLSQTPAYRWLVANAARFGFVNYPFEPWHWEWAGEP